ncbi:DNA polymerase-3 subunit delta' [Alicyclobacillus sacchari]|uniref:DNA polymerase-3 subunit delta n=1 Tax=Alicyclobacillus sacchari TaxID=392010 RepID=A0A4V6QD17_9BACL|nr:hypothetical protein [Alicyclobacillus sacchari]TDY46318.1 DNA polymerase-3 subunit delta' [Alicyclobacillus sacchari]GMA57169.1 hypothetical protein GCM10025858_16720 [Alicyclobacillus sacchari]
MAAAEDMANGSLIGLPQPLITSLRGKSLLHAVLLVGTPTDTARAAMMVARYLLCERPADTPCGTCRACVQMAAGVHPDFLEAGTEGLKTADVEMVQDWLGTKAHGGCKVYVLHGVDHMTGVAANRMLKTLEEPEPNVYAIMTAKNRHNVLSTIRSRAFAYDLAPADPYTATDPGAAEQLRRLLNTTEDPSFDGFVDQVIKWTEMWLVERAPAWTLAAAWQSLSEQIPAEDSLLLLAEWLREVLNARAKMPCGRFRDWEQAILRIAPILEIHQWAEAIEIVLDSRLRLQSHVAALLNFEQMCIRLREVSS